jgi:hypothetical protein
MINKPRLTVSLPRTLFSMPNNPNAKVFYPWERYRPKEGSMMRKTIIALFAVAAVGLVQPTVASARGGGGGGHGGGFHGGGFGGGGFRGGGFRGGFAGGGFHGGRFHGGGFHGGFHRRAIVGFGFGPYYDGYYPYAYDDSYYGDGGCYLLRRRVHTRHGWRIRPVQVCG